MEERVKVTELKVGDRFRFGKKPYVFVVVDLNAENKHGPAILFSSAAVNVPKTTYKLGLTNPSVTVWRIVPSHILHTV